MLVCGGRNFNDRGAVYRKLDAIHAETPISCIIEGGAGGADYYAALWSVRNGLYEHVRMSAGWALYGKSAGPMRNQRMLEVGKPDMVIAFPGGRGTADMVRRSRQAGVPVVGVGDAQVVEV